MVAVIVGLCVAALVAIGAIAGDDELDETSAKAIGSAAAVMIFAATALGSETLRLRRADLLWLAYAGFVVAGIGLVDWQALAVVAVLYLLATLLVPLVRRLESAPSPSPPGPT